MKISERYNIDNLKNRSAEMVFSKLETMLENTDNFCHCEECVLDLVAYTLNHVTPLYGTSLLGPLHPNKDKEKKKKRQEARAAKQASSLQPSKPAKK